MALVMALWSLMAMVWLMGLAQYLRTIAKGYRLADHRLCRLCMGQRNHPHNKALQCPPYLEKTGLSYPTRSGV
jgi:hypothetical protein